MKCFVCFMQSHVLFMKCRVQHYIWSMLTMKAWDHLIMEIKKPILRFQCLKFNMQIMSQLYEKKKKKSEHSNPWLCRVWWRMYKRSISNTENHICSGKHEPTENFSGNIHRARYQYSYCSEVMNTITLSRAYIISFMNYYHYINCHHYVNYTQLSLQVNCCHNLNNIIRLQLLRFLKGNSATNGNLLI